MLPITEIDVEELEKTIIENPGITWHGLKRFGFSGAWMKNAFIVLYEKNKNFYEDDHGKLFIGEI